MCGVLLCLGGWKDGALPVISDRTKTGPKRSQFWISEYNVPGLWIGRLDAAYKHGIHLKVELNCIAKTDSIPTRSYYSF